MIGENEFLRFEVVPNRGGKAVSFLNKRTGREWCYQNQCAWSSTTYGMNWGDADRSGWDEIFPTIQPCMYPQEPWQSTLLPDHGEVWTLQWQCETVSDELLLRVKGVKLPYALSKQYRLDGQQLTIEFEVENFSPFPMCYMWAAHYLLNVHPGMCLVTDTKWNEVEVCFSYLNRLIRNGCSRLSYPLVSLGEGSVDLSVLETPKDSAEKYWFVQPLSSSKASVGIRDNETGDALTYQFYASDIPYLGIWLNYGGLWGDYTAAIEPSTGYLDSLSTAHHLKKVKWVQAYGRNRWKLCLQLTDCFWN